MALTSLSLPMYKSLQTKFKNSKSAYILKAVPLKKVFFTHKNCFIYQLLISFRIYTVSGYIIDYIFLPNITLLLISNSTLKIAIPFVLTEHYRPKLHNLYQTF